MKIEHGRMNLRRKQQLIYLIADLISSELVWICFLAFRWMVYDGRTVLLDDVLIPAFSFWLPMLVYPVICLVIYYLSGYYLRPFQKPLWREFLRTFGSAIIISIIFSFFIFYIIRIISIIFAFFIISIVPFFFVFFII